MPNWGSAAEERPLVATEPVKVSVSNYNGLQDALNKTLPWFSAYSIDYDLDGGSYGDVRIPAYLGTWFPRDANDELVPLQIKNGSVEAMTATGGAGVLQIKNVDFTGTSSKHDANCAFANFNTHRVGLYDCSISNNANGVLSYGGDTIINGTSFDVSGWGVRVQNGGRYWESKPGASGSAGGTAYVPENGFILFNHVDASAISGSPQVAVNDGSLKGLALDEANSRLFGPNSIVMTDQTSGEEMLFQIRDGRANISQN